MSAIVWHGEHWLLSWRWSAIGVSCRAVHSRVCGLTDQPEPLRLRFECGYDPLPPQNSSCIREQQSHYTNSVLILEAPRDSTLDTACLHTSRDCIYTY